MGDDVTEQERFWAGRFGDEYVRRNETPEQLASRTALFARILRCTAGVGSALELGANTGLNLQAIERVRPGCRLAGVEINRSAFERLRLIPNIAAVHGSILAVDSEELGKSDFCFTAGVLIHIHPDRLPDAYHRLYQCASSYVCVIEYYNPTPVEVRYRGHERKLFKRDFAGELMDRYPELRLVDYGFVYHRDPNFPGDDLTWFLLRKC